jgi:hypothetical protein
MLFNSNKDCGHSLNVHPWICQWALQTDIGVFLLHVVRLPLFGGMNADNSIVLEPLHCDPYCSPTSSTVRIHAWFYMIPGRLLSDYLQTTYQRGVTQCLR